MQKLTNRDIERIVKKWKKGKQISEIANYFGVSRQWVHHLLNRYKQSGMIPVLHKPGRKPKGIAEETRFLSIQFFSRNLESQGNPGCRFLLFQVLSCHQCSSLQYPFSRTTLRVGASDARTRTGSVSRQMFGNEPAHNKILPDIFSTVSDRDFRGISSFNVKNEHFIKDAPLRDALMATNGHDLSRLPEIPLSIVPEMKRFEIRLGLVDIILQLFDEKSPGKTPYQMCEEGLERLFEHIPSNARQSLVKRIAQEMENLKNTELSGYIEFKDGIYRATSKFKQYPKSRQAIAMRLQDWAYSRQIMITDYIEREN